MSVRRILPDTDPALHKKCHPVTRFNVALHALLDDMHDTLEKANGAGLAAPQVGILRRVCLVTRSDGTVAELINPTILAASGSVEEWEACLSVPGMCGRVIRPATVRVLAYDRQGNAFEMEDSGMAARCVCHELDHLDGKLYSALVDRLYTNDEADVLIEAEEEARLQEEDTP